MKANIGIKQEYLDEAAQYLSTILADEFLLNTKTRKAHWNIEGNDFYSKHKLFETQYEELDAIVDDVAERIRSIGHYAPASLKEFLSLTRLTEQSIQSNDSKGHIKELLADHESIITYCREKIYKEAVAHFDAVTCDFITTLIGKHEKTAWMLRAQL